MIPLFPEFKKLSLEDMQDLHNRINLYSPYSDFNFVSLWINNIKDDVLVSLLNDNLVVRVRDYVTSERFYTFIGKASVIDTLSKLLSLSEREGFGPRLKLIPEETLLSDPDIYILFDVKEDRDNFDYIIPLKNISSLGIKEYRSKRKLLSYLFSHYEGIRAEELNLKDLKVQKQILDVFYIWEKKKNLSRYKTKHELEALTRLLNRTSDFNLYALGVYYRFELVGFIIEEVVHNGYVMGHFLKVDPSFRGSYELLHKVIANKLLEKGCEFINFEQDLGIEGLRKSKKLWVPSHFLKKYIVSKKMQSSVKDILSFT